MFSVTCKLFLTNIQMAFLLFSFRQIDLFKNKEYIFIEINAKKDFEGALDFFSFLINLA